MKVPGCLEIIFEVIYFYRIFHIFVSLIIFSFGFNNQHSQNQMILLINFIQL